MQTRELPILRMNNLYGGNQYLFTDILMKIGGCSTVCACHAAAQLALVDPARRGLSPLPSYTVSQSAFDAFAKDMFRFVYPGIRGIPTTGLFCQAFSDYAAWVGQPVRFDQLQGTEPLCRAKDFIRTHIDGGYSVQYLLLRHRNRRFCEIQWHWFTVTGYEEEGEDMTLIYSTFGKREKAPLSLLWDTGWEEKGGLVVVR